MKIMKMTLENFKGIRNLAIDFDGKSVAIHGKNGSGKSTIADAFSWILTDKPYSGLKGFNPQPLDENGVPVHNQDTSVSIVLAVGDDEATPLTIKKTLKEKWTKKRGSVTAEFGGRVTEYEVNGLPKKKKEFDKIIEDICPSDKMQPLSNISYFCSDMKWQDRRQLLMDVCGDISDDQILGANDLEPLRIAAGDTPIDDYRKLIEKNMKVINGKLKSMPERIDEAKKAIPDGAEKLKEDDIKEEIRKLYSRKKDFENQLSSLENNDAEKRKEQEIFEIRAQISKEKSDYEMANAAKATELAKARSSAEMTLEKVKTAVSSGEYKLDSLNRQSDALRERIFTASRNWKIKKRELTETNAQEFDESSNVCPYCHQPLPNGMADENRKHFNEAKAKKIEALKTDLRKINEEGEEASASLKSLKNEIAEVKGNIENAKSAKKSAEEQLEAFRGKEIKPFESTETYQTLYKKLGEVASRPAESVNEDAVLGIRSQMFKTQEEIDEKNDLISAIRVAEAQKKRIHDLKVKTDMLQDEYFQNEQLLNLCEDFTKKKVDMITQNVNQKFKSVSFRLFETQVNGGLKDCCDVMIPVEGGSLVPYGDANTASKVNAGVEIISTLQDHFDIHMPVFIDNAESVTHIVAPEDMQMVKLVVDDSKENLEKEE